MDKKIKGFSKDEVFELYRFVEIYESDIKARKLQEVILQYPLLADKEWEKIKSKLTHFQMKSQSAYKTPIPPNTLLDGDTGIIRPIIIAHIRNAFVHLSLEKDSQYPTIYLTDMYNRTDKENKYKKGDLSAQYFFEEELFWKIIHLFTNPNNL